MIEVIKAGLFTTVQDLGRNSYAHFGVSAAGAADPLSLRIGNLLAGNEESAPALEMTMLGAWFCFHAHTVFVLSGADFDATLAGNKVPLFCPTAVRAGDVLQCGSARTGARGYICLSGGVAVPPMLGSVSTHVPSGLGGYQGRALRKGDKLGTGISRKTPCRRPLPTQFISALQVRTHLRVTPGGQARRFTAEAAFLLVSNIYRVSEESNRTGLRLLGSSIPYPGEMLSEGMPLGAIQVPPSGQPILLFVDAQTTGGYPVIACVISADLRSVGQLRPGQDVTFECITLERARVFLLEQEEILQEIRSKLA